MIEILPPLGKYKYDTWRILSVKFYIDNSVRLWSCIRNINNDEDRGGGVTSPLLFFFLIQGFRFGGGILPSLHRHHMGGSPDMPSLFPRSQLLVAGMVRFLLRRILG
jgi:hypothetical protein